MHKRRLFHVSMLPLMPTFFLASNAIYSLDALRFKTIIPFSVTSPIFQSSSDTLLAGILIVSILNLIFILIFGYVYWNSRLRDSRTKTSGNHTENNLATLESRITEHGQIQSDALDMSNVDLDIFLRDVYQAYSSVSDGGRYVQLDSLKRKVAVVYPEFDKLLILARQRFPHKIWLDKDSRGSVIIKIVI